MAKQSSTPMDRIGRRSNDDLSLKSAFQIGSEVKKTVAAQAEKAPSLLDEPIDYKDSESNNIEPKVTEQVNIKPEIAEPISSVSGTTEPVHKGIPESELTPEQKKALEKMTSANNAALKQAEGARKELSGAYSNLVRKNVVNKGVEKGTMASVVDAFVNILGTYNNAEEETATDGINMSQEDLAQLIQSQNSEGSMSEEAARTLAGMLTRAMMNYNKESAEYISRCLPDTASTCRACPYNELCDKSLTKFPPKRICITLPEDVALAIDVMLQEDPSFYKLSRSAFLTAIIRGSVMEYIEKARKILNRQRIQVQKYRENSSELIAKLLATQVDNPPTEQ